ncbi:hypothetical protein [Granulicella arctica]|uniref:Uncharacterized protein n=1 Tax=Granulicella arctica TaxID=940613 RepID=A0A7Y9TJW7_9BACT|nr:hypothetical protein [Granulicella arctica]NYF78702.1 hypothetical protein [Granulicella arctica]
MELDRLRQLRTEMSDLHIQSVGDRQFHTPSRLEAATRPYQMPECWVVRFWSRKYAQRRG